MDHCISLSVSEFSSSEDDVKLSEDDVKSSEDAESDVSVKVKTTTRDGDSSEDDESSPNKRSYSERCTCQYHW